MYTNHIDSSDIDNLMIANVTLDSKSPFTAIVALSLFTEISQSTLISYILFDV